MAEVLSRGVRDHQAMLAAVGEPERAVTIYHRSPTLTMFSAVWIPQTQEEDGIHSTGAKCLFEGDVAVLPDTTIHSVTNPLERFTGGIHIDGGDFFATTRSQWNPETLDEEPSEGAVIRGIFERANERKERCKGL